MRLYKVIGVDDLEGLTFAQCTTHEKAKKAQELFVDVIPDKLIAELFNKE